MHYDLLASLSLKRSTCAALFNAQNGPYTLLLRKTVNCQLTGGAAIAAYAAQLLRNESSQMPTFRLK
jgi:hypothetical protein